MTTEAVLKSKPIPQEAHQDRRRWYALLILSLSLMLVIIDGTVVNVAIPTIREDFNASLADVEWVNSIYLLVVASTLILWGKVGDIYGRRLLFLVGVVLFGIGSALVGASSSIGMLIAMRAFQGIGAAILSPSTLSIITTMFKGKERGIAFGVWGATAGVAAALGPLLGGWVITNASWRWAFYINIPVAMLAFIGSLWAIRESRDEYASKRFDILGTVLGGIGLGGVVFGLIEGQTYGWWDIKSAFSVLGWDWPLDSVSLIPFTLAIGTVLLALFTWYELRQERMGGEPLFEFSLLKYRSFRYGLITGLIVNLGEFGMVFSLSIFLQGVLKLTAFETGVTLLPFAGMALVAAPMAGMLSSKIGPKWIITIGMGVEALALIWMSQVIGPNVRVRTLTPSLMIYGAGMGLAVAQLANVVLYDIPKNKSGVGSGANSTIRQVGAALGVAVIGAVMTTTMENSAKDRLLDSQLLASSPVYTMMRDAMVEDLGHSSGMGHSAPSMGDPNEPVNKEVSTIFTAANADAAANSALVAALAVGLGTLSSIMLPNRKEALDETEE
jgi:EmrB/QacA subfamily drug resistance transporter